MERQVRKLETEIRPDMKFGRASFLRFYLTSSLIAALVFAIVPASITAQEDLPDKIRGYKVHKAKILVRTADDQPSDSNARKGTEAFISIGEPDLRNIGLTGVTFEISAEIDSIEESGSVDFLTFQDFRVNGLRVNIEEYRESFDFEKNRTISLPKPITIRVGTGQTLLGAAREIGDSKEKWRVTGRVFVFGKFKWSVFNFKRVVPVDVDVWITNPVRNR